MDFDLDELRKKYGSLNPSAAPAPQAPQKKGKGFWADQISTGGGIGGALAGGSAGAALGSIVPGIGTAIGGLAGAVLGGFAGGAGGQAIENKVTNTDDNVWKEGLISGVTSLPPFGILKGGKVAVNALKSGQGAGAALRAGAETATAPGTSLLSRVSTRAGEKLSQASDDLTIKTLGLTKGQKNKILTETGQKASDIASKYNVKTADDIPKRLQPLFDEYKTVVGKIPGTIGANQVAGAFKAIYEPMLAKGVPTGQQAIGQKLKAEAENLLQGIGNKGITPTELNAKKTAFDKLAYKLKASDPGAADINKLSRDALNQLLGDIADQAGVKTTKGTLHDLGKEISAVSQLNKAAKANIEGAGGHTAVGLTSGIGAAAGAGAGGIPGMIAGGILTKVANSPRGQRAIGETFDRTSGLLSRLRNNASPVSPMSTATRIGAAGAVGGIPEAINTGMGQSSDQASQVINAPATSPASIDSMNANIDAPYQNSGDLSSVNGGGDNTADIQTQLEQAALKALAAGDKEGLDNIIKVANLFEARAKAAEKSKGDKASLSDSAINNITDTESAMQQLEGLRGITQSDPLLGRVRQYNPYDTDFQAQQADIDRVRQIVGKALEGGVLRKEDEEKYKKILPTMLDTREVAQEKIDSIMAQLRSRLAEYKQYQANYGKGAGELSNNFSLVQ